MKKYIIKIGLVVLFANIVSCSPEDPKLDYRNVGASVAVVENNLSVLDYEQNIKLKTITKSDVNISKIEVYRAPEKNIDEKEPVKLGDGFVLDKDNIAFNSSIIKNWKADQTFSLIVLTTFSNGEVVKNYYNLKVVKGITLTSGVERLMYLDNRPGKNIIRYKTYKQNDATTIESVVVQLKKNKAGVYSNPVSFQIEKGEIDLGETIDFKKMNLNIGDTLFYKFTAKSITNSDYIEASIAIVTQNFEAEKKGILDNISINALGNKDKNKFNLAKATSYPDTDTKNAEIVFASNLGLAKEGTTDIDFVKIDKPSNDYYTKTDLFKAEQDYLAGTKVTSIGDLKKDNIVIYRIIRDKVVYYGIIKIGDVTNDSKFIFDYKEGSIIM